MIDRVRKDKDDNEIDRDAPPVRAGRGVADDPIIGRPRPGLGHGPPVRPDRRIRTIAPPDSQRCYDRGPRKVRSIFAAGSIPGAAVSRPEEAPAPRPRESMLIERGRFDKKSWPAESTVADPSRPAVGSARARYERDRAASRSGGAGPEGRPGEAKLRPVRSHPARSPGRWWPARRAPGDRRRPSQGMVVGRAAKPVTDHEPGTRPR